MAFLKDLFDIRDIKGPIFYKDFSDNNKQLLDLEKLYSNIYSDKKKIILRDINNLKIGLNGEKDVTYELKNSYIPMICLHDIRIEHDGNVAQFDFVLVTEHFIMILETKKLNGDIVINEAGEFIRRFKNKSGKVIKQEGMYSPIAQNDRHVRILEDFLKKNKIIRRVPVYSAVVIANSKSIINRSKAPHAIKNSIFKLDGVTAMINKKIANFKKDEKLFETHMIKIANFILDNNCEITYNYYKKYGLTEEDFIQEKTEQSLENIEDMTIVNDEVEETSKIEETTLNTEVREENKIQEENTEEVLSENDNELYEELKKYRYEKSIEEKLKAYCIFNNKTLDEIVKTKPKTKEELLKISGFGQVKVDKYGEAIIDIITK